MKSKPSRVVVQASAAHYLLSSISPKVSVCVGGGREPGREGTPNIQGREGGRKGREKWREGKKETRGRRDGRKGRKENKERRIEERKEQKHRRREEMDEKVKCE